MEGKISFYAKNRIWILPLVILGLLFIVFIPLLSIDSVAEVITNPEGLKSYLTQYEGWAILVYVLLSIAVVVIPVLPNEIVPVAGGLVFGFWTALVFGLLARIIGSSTNYFLGTKIGGRLYKKFLTAGEEERVEKYTKKIGWQAVFISRFLPSADTDLVAYLSGMVRMNYLTFILASFFGMIVPVSVNILIGSALFTNKYLLFGLVGFYILGMLFAPKIMKRFVGEESK